MIFAVVLIFSVHGQFSHLSDDGRGIVRSLPLALDEVLLHLCADRRVDVLVQRCVAGDPAGETITHQQKDGEIYNGSMVRRGLAGRDYFLK